MLSKQPNAVSYQFKFVTLLSTANVNNPFCYQWFALQGHTAIAECEARLAAQKRNVVVVTQNIDELHFRAGSKNVVELHGIAEYFICK